MKIENFLVLGLIITSNCYAIGSPGCVRTAHSSTHKTAQESIVAHESIAVHDKALIKGVLICQSYSSAIGNYDGINKQGCRMGNLGNYYSISIEEFFNKFKPLNANQITMVIYDDNEFKIYYN